MDNILVCIMIYVIEVKHKINDICTNLFNTHNGPLWETNIVYINLYCVATYCTSYLTKIIKYVT